MSSRIEMIENFYNEYSKMSNRWFPNEEKENKLVSNYIPTCDIVMPSYTSSTTTSFTKVSGGNMSGGSLSYSKSVNPMTGLKTSMSHMPM